MTNKQIAAKFREIKKLLKSQGETNEFRLAAYDKAAYQIELLGENLQDLYDNGGTDAVVSFVKEVRAIGPRSLEKIIQFCSTGTSPELEQLLANRPVVQDSMFDEQDMAPKRKASKNIDETVNAVRRPWEQADAVAKRVMDVVKKYFAKAMVCGSYRRKKADVKDIDIGLTQFSLNGAEYFVTKPSEAFAAIQKELAIPSGRVIKLGESQTSFYIESASGAWQIDFWYTADESWGTSILFATGSAEYNVGMRQWVKARGYKLNRYGLFRVKPEGDELVASKTEEDVFAALGLKWLPPEQRSIFDHLKQSL